MKRCGKSAPPRWQRRGHGKPRAEQGQIGERMSALLLPPRRDRFRVGCSIPGAIPELEE